ncbi:lysophospholipid acyltransferase family protein [Lacticaseibacillus hulanensis]|uniref:lysophospholipid acyltransferase family protein n=1 Tax=Lacticaseibacillus hulanensis TaxID=2493111 RepID=UPI000FDC6059|nr:lysophospholipid acyltransferase family protein [Lacticaseibacillus hulanensis]
MSIADQILHGKHEQTIANIARAVADSTLNAKVEPGDPELTAAEAKQELLKYQQRRTTAAFRINTLITRKMLDVTAAWVGHSVTFTGMDNLARVKSGAIVTSNHFSPIENLFVRSAARGHRLHIVSQLTNLKMTGILGYLMNYGDTLPISSNREWMGREFPKLIQSNLADHGWVLIYPEQEMWFNYRKPRPMQRGAYYYAARFNVPVVSMFVSMTDEARHVTKDFNAIHYTVHVLPPIYPDESLGVRAASLAMQKQDYAQKCAAYEQAYGKKLDYAFAPSDIAGWRGQEPEA